MSNKPFSNNFDLPLDDSSTTYYPYVRSLDGKLCSLGTIRQGGRLVPRFVPESHTELEKRSIVDLLGLYREITAGLSRRQRRTLLPLLLGRTPEEVAISEGVTREAIIARVRGNKGRGGMIHKNEYVAIWWKNKKKRNQYE